ncbi:hypothetical protein [Enterobacter asburiae]|uniref:hypothetical protein n=1 Tax=Enterobacter asburiae TaxID=61645 RepID=UPI00301E3E1C
MNDFYGGFNFGGNPLGGFAACAFNNGLNQYLDKLRSQLVQQYAKPQQQNPMQLVNAAISESVSATDMELIAVNIAARSRLAAYSRGQKICAAGNDRD